MEERPPSVPRWFRGGVVVLFLLTVLLGVLIVVGLLLVLGPYLVYDWADGR